MFYYGDNGKIYETAEKIGEGGEGRVYNIKGQDSIVAKILKETSMSTGIKMKALTTDFNWSPFIMENTMLPITTLYDNAEHNGDCVGFIMNKLKCTDVLLDVYNQPKDRISIYNQACIAKNICQLVDEIHRTGYKNGEYTAIIGDFNPKNIFIDRRTGKVQLTDTDSFHITVNYRNKKRQFRCLRLYESLIHVIPEIIKVCRKENATLDKVRGETFTRFTDYFCVAYHVHYLLLGIDPYALESVKKIDNCTESVTNVPNNAVLACAGNYVYTNVRPGYRVPVRFPDFNVLTPKLQSLFKRAFQDGADDPSARPTAAEFVTALDEYISQLDYCCCSGWDHYIIHSYNKNYCEWCRVEHENHDMRQFYTKNVPFMTNTELIHCLDLELKDIFKGEICYNLGIRLINSDRVVSVSYLNRALKYFGNDMQPGVIKRRGQINKYLSMI